MDAAGRGDLFERIKFYLTGESHATAQLEIAEQLGMTVDAVKAAIYRLRQKFRHRLRAEILQTVGDGEDVEDELRSLFAAFRRSPNSRDC